MSNITSYLSNKQFLYHELSLSTSGASGVSGASGRYIEYGTVKNLSITSILDLFSHGDLTVGELDKWLEAHKKQVTDLKKDTNGKLVKYTLTDIILKMAAEIY